MYLAVNRNGTEVRLRRQDDKHFQTIKTGMGLQRGEIEIKLSRKQFNSLWPATRGHRLEKVRYTLKWRGNKIELDVFKKKLSGLLIAEVEFKSKPEAEVFSPPEWFGQEVTDDKSYKNVNLALRKSRTDATHSAICSPKFCEHVPTFARERAMKITIAVALMLAAIGLITFAQISQPEPQRIFIPCLWGKVEDEGAHGVPNMTICFLPSERPINGRIPCNKTSYDGSYAITVKDSPDKYIVCASTTDSPFIFEQDKDKSHRVTCSKPIEFGAADDCRKVDLKFKAE